VIANGASTLIRKTSSDSSVVVSRKGPIRPVMPALLTRQSAEPVHGLRHEVGSTVDICELGLQHHGLHPELAALRSHDLRLVASLPVRQDEVVSAGRESAGDGGSDPPAAAGDQGGWTH
jgi:hypothetical protein